MSEFKSKPNNELVNIRKDLKDEFEKVRVDLIKLYDYWRLIEKKYNEVNNELNDRFGVNNK
jgi:hypothetical protein